MKSERLVALRKLDAHQPTAPRRAAAAARRSTASTCAAAPRRRPAFAQAEGTRWRIRFGKLGRGAFISHLDTMRLLIRVFRRARRRDDLFQGLPSRSRS